MIKSLILVPLLNANEPEARLVAIHTKEGQLVDKGTLLFTVETTKAAADIHSPERGFLHVLVKEGDTLSVGDRIAILAETPDEKIDLSPVAQPPVPSNGKLRITKPARALAESLGVDWASLPENQLITETMVRQLAGKKDKAQIKLKASRKPYIIVYGGGGHAKATMDMLRQIGDYTIAGLIDDNLSAGTRVLGLTVLGTRQLLPALLEQGVKLAANGVGGILDIAVRVKIFELLKENGFSLPALIHPRAAIEPSASIGDGVQVFANAYVGSEAVLRPMCMINTNAVVSHDCEIGSYSHIAPGALLAGQVQIGSRTLIGMGVTTAIGVKVGSGVRIGNGAIVLADVPDRTIIQAGRYWVGKAEQA